MNVLVSKSYFVLKGNCKDAGLCGYVFEGGSLFALACELMDVYSITCASEAFSISLFETR